jgi:hypothetical protein
MNFAACHFEFHTLQRSKKFHVERCFYSILQKFVGIILYFWDVQFMSHIAHLQGKNESANNDILDKFGKFYLNYLYIRGTGIIKQCK